MSWESEKKKLEDELESCQTKVDYASAQLRIVLDNLRHYTPAEIRKNLKLIKGGLNE